MTFLWLVLGVLLLAVGAELLVRGAVELALAIRISPLVVGLTVVAFGTSGPPELVVSLESVYRGNQDIAFGNVVGSNVFNVLAILGISATIIPMVVSSQLVRFDVPILIACSLLVGAMSLDATLGRGDGALLVVGLVVYLSWSVHSSRRLEIAADGGKQEQERPRRPGPAAALGFALLGLVGLGLLIVGSSWFLDAAVAIARSLGFSELVIGLTLVAGGTSLPELATSVVAALRGQRDMAVGNVVGSNLFNLLAVLGMSSLAAPTGITVPPEALHADIPVMIAVAVICLPICYTGYTVARWEGALLLVLLAGYLVYLAIETSMPQWMETYERAVVWGVLPGLALLFAYTSFLSHRTHRRARRRGEGWEPEA